VIVLISDDQDVYSLPVMRKLMGYPEGSWVNFRNAYANDSICCPTRATLLTGQYSHLHGVIGNEFGQRLDDSNTLPVWLKGAGYRTGLIGKYLNGYPWDRQGYVPPGWDYFNTEGSNPDKHTSDAISFINGAGASPFFLYVAFKEPHDPATPLPRYVDAAVYVPPDRPNFNEADVSDKPLWVRDLPLLSQPTIDAWRAERVASQRSLLGIDDGVQAIVDHLKQTGRLDNTLIFYLSDHGFSWGSHRWLKKHCAYEECSRFPLLVRFPGRAGNREETRIVSTVDITATVAHYAGVSPRLPQNGTSLVPLLAGTAAGWDDRAVLQVRVGGDRQFFGLAAPGWKYVAYDNGDRELYDLTDDPYELANKANDSRYWATHAALHQQLTGIVGADLVTKSRTSSASLRVGQPVTFTVTVQNTGPKAANSVRLSDRLDYLTYGSSTSSKGSCSAGGTPTLVQCELGDLRVGETVTVQITATAAAATGRAGVVNVAAASTTAFDPTPHNAQGAATIRIEP
jgi:uncharacterized repeat protein (TIGR01451 family)